MSTLIVDELWPGVVFSQPFKITKPVGIAHIRPWVYVHGSIVDGQLKCTVKQGATELASDTITFGQINAAMEDTYNHGFIKFRFNSLVLRVPEDQTEQEYIIEYEMINHTLNAGGFVGIVRRWEEKTYPTYGDGVTANEAPNDMIEPSGLEIFTYEAV